MGHIARIFRLAALTGSLLLAAAPGFAQQATPPSSQAPFTFSTMETVRARGYVICAASRPTAGFAQVNSDGLWTGFDVDFCRAIAAAIFGDPAKVEFRPLAGEARFAHLALREVDVLARNAPWTMSRDTTFGATYVAPSFYDGQAFLVRSQLGVVSAYELEDVTICVAVRSEAAARIEDFFFESQAAYTLVGYEDREDLAVAYRTGQCDALTGPASWLQAVARGLPDASAHQILPERLSKDPYGPVVRNDDAQWAAIVRWTLHGLVNAEEFGVTSVNVDSMLSARTPAIRRLLGVEGDFGAGLGLRPTWMRDVIRSVGNYGEIYERNFGSASGFPLLRGQNALWVNGGLLYAPPMN